MLDRLTYEEYSGCVNEMFTVIGLGVELELIEISDKKQFKNQEMFSLIFRGPRESFLEQQTYLLENEKLGNGELFLVPIGELETGFKYEAGFNRLLD